MITRNYIGQHFLVSVTDMWWRISVIDRRGDEKRFRHFCGHTGGLIVVGQAHRLPGQAMRLPYSSTRRSLPDQKNRCRAIAPLANSSPFEAVARQLIV